MVFFLVRKGVVMTVQNATQIVLNPVAEIAAGVNQ